MHEPTPTTSPVNVLDMLAGDAQPFTIKNPLETGSLAHIISKARREEKRLAHEARAKENFKPCRKKCPLFKCEKCWEKTFEQQRECYDKKYNNQGGVA